MPAYNREKPIAAAIRSVLAQSYRHWELIIVDDGSRDRTYRIAREFSTKDPRIRCYQKKNGGPGSARNFGIDRARGEIIAFLDSDDLWVPRKLEVQLRAMYRHRVDLVFSDAKSFEDGKRGFIKGRYCRVEGRFTGRQLIRAGYHGATLKTSSSLLKQDILRKYGKFVTRAPFKFINEDSELWTRLAQSGATFYITRQKLVSYRVHAESLSRNPVQLFETYLMLFDKYQRFHRVPEKLKIERGGTLCLNLIMLYQQQGDLRAIERLLRKQERDYPKIYQWLAARLG
jgi:teichuronic acid biosynthesis glycosyltransferase TuaG